MSKMQFPFKFDRLINDFIFMTYLVGNDFLPSFPGFDISFFFKIDNYIIIS